MNNKSLSYTTITNLFSNVSSNNISYTTNLFPSIPPNNIQTNINNTSYTTITNLFPNVQSFVATNTTEHYEAIEANEAIEDNPDKKVFNSDTCSVCLDPLEVSTINTTILKCGHTFHFSCIKSQHKCPICRINM